MEKLFRKLRRELSRNPKQTAVLAVGLLVAVYFWAPLAAGWLPGGKKKQPAAKTVPQAMAAGDAQAAGGPSPAALRWQDLAQWMENDPLWRPPQKRHEIRDPFRAAQEAAPEAAADSPPLKFAEAPEIAPTPASSPPWKLEGVFLGRARTAMISGDAYREGDRLPREAGYPEARVAEIHADHILVRVGSKIMRLELERSSLAPGDTIAAGPTPSGT
jgi:hypothetical protein